MSLQDLLKQAQDSTKNTAPAEATTEPTPAQTGGSLSSLLSQAQASVKNPAPETAPAVEPTQEKPQPTQTTKTTGLFGAVNPNDAQGAQQNEGFFGKIGDAIGTFFDRPENKQVHPDDSAGQKLQGQQQMLEALAPNIEKLSKNLDPTDKKAVDFYNGQVEHYNTILDQFKKDNEAYNTPEAKKARIDAGTAADVENAKNATVGKQLPSAIIESLPIIGRAYKAIHEEEGSNPETFNYLKNTDLLKGIPSATLEQAKALPKGLISPILTLAGAVGQVAGNNGVIKFNIPGLGEVSNIQSRIFDRVLAGENPVTLGLDEGAGELLNSLFLYSAAKAPFTPRTSTIARLTPEQTTSSANSRIIGKNTVPDSAVPRSFRLYQKPTITSAVFTEMSPEFIKHLQEKGVDLSKYDPKKPTYFKFEMEPNGQITGKIIQVKPSYFDTFKQKFDGVHADVPSTELTTVYEAQNVPKQDFIKGIEESVPAPVNGPLAPAPAPQGAVIEPGAEAFVPPVTAIHNAEMTAIGDQTPAEVRDNLAKYNSMLDETSGAERTAVVAKSNAARDILNEYTSKNKETAIEIKVPGVHAEVEVVKYNDGKWGVRSSAGTVNSGMGTPFGTDVYDTRAQAVQAGKESVERYLRSSKVHESSATIPKIDKALVQLSGNTGEVKKPAKAPVIKKSSITQNFKVGEDVQFSGKKWQIESVLKAGNDFKYELSNSETGTKLWTNQMGLDSANSTEKKVPQESVTAEKPTAKVEKPKNTKTKTPEKSVTEPKSTKKPRKVLETTKKKERLSGEASGMSAKIGDFEQVKNSEKPNGSDFKLHEATIALGKKYIGGTFGESYLSRGNAGQFHTDTGNVRTQGINAFSVNVHEMTHSIDEQNGITDQLLKFTLSDKGQKVYSPDEHKDRKALNEVYMQNYPNARITKPLRTRMREGYATLLQKYTEAPRTTETKYPDAVREFLKPGGKYYKPIVGQFLADARDIVDKYSSLSDLDKIGARVTSDSNPSGKDTFFNLGDKIRTFTVDNVYPLEKLANQAGISNTNADPSLWARQYSAANGMIINNIKGKHGLWTLVGNEFKQVNKKNWGDLVKMVEKKKILDQFGNYLVARDQYHAFKEMDDLKKQADDVFAEAQEHADSFEPGEAIPAEDRAYIQELRAEARQLMEKSDEIKGVLERNQFTRKEVTDAYMKNKDRFTDEEALFDELELENLKMLHNPEINLLDRERFNNLSTRKGYAPLKREFYDELVGDETAIGNKKTFGTKKVSSQISRKGSSRTIINPLLSGMQNHAEVMRKGLKQLVYNKVVKMGLIGSFPELFQKQQLKAIPDPKTGVIHFPQEKDPNIIMGRIGGKRVPMLVDGYVKKVVEDVLGYENISAFEKIVMGANRIFTKGTTGLFPGFALTNFAVDQITASAQTRTDYVPIYSALKSLGKAALNRAGKEAEYLTEYMVIGGERQTFVGWQNMTAREVAQKIAHERKGVLKFMDALEKGVDILAIPSKYSEITTRATEYIRSRQNGDPQIVALEKAGRVTAPFHHIGTLGGRVGKTAIKSIPFFSPALQVFDQTLRTIANKESRSRFLWVYAAITAALLASQLNVMKRGTDQQKQSYKDLSAQEKAMYLYFPSPNGTDLVKLRVPQELTTLGAVTNQIIADKAYGTRYTPMEYVEGSTAFLPNQLDFTDPARMLLQWIPQILKPAVETAAGVKDFPTVLPLVNQTLAARPPELQYNDFTSAGAKWLGKEFKMSPIKIDYLLNGYFGRASGFVTGKPGVYNPTSTLKQKPYFQGGRTVQQYYDLKKTNDQEYNAYLHKLKPMRLGEASAILAQRGRLKVIGELMTAYSDVDEKKNPARAQRLRDQIVEKIAKLK